MKNIFKKIYRALLMIGIDPLKQISFLKNAPVYLKEWRILKKQLSGGKDFNLVLMRPMMHDRHSSSGTMTGHYFHQDLLIAQKIYRNNPKRHVDIGSSVDGFVAHVASFRKIEIIDIRPNMSKSANIVFIRADMMKGLPADLIQCCDSVSSLHAIEHFGLGRYGDKIDVNGHLKGLQNIYKMLKKGGKFYFSVPIGKQRIEFNAHRVFEMKYLLGLLADQYEINSFSYVDDSGELFENVFLKKEDIDSTLGCFYGCGIFELTKS